MTTHPEADVREWLADALESKAQWREWKFEEYPDDHRNERAAAALRAAAAYARFAETSPPIALFVKLVAACEDVGWHVTASPDFGEEAGRLASRYFFDNLPGSCDDRTHENLLAELYEAMLDELIGLDGDAIEIPSESALAQLLQSRRPSKVLARDPLTDLVDELREARRTEEHARRLAQLQRVSDYVAMVRDVAYAEADENGSLQSLGVQVGRPKTFWNARKQLELSVAVYLAESGRQLPSCEELAIGSQMNHVSPVQSAATSAFEELLREAAVPLLGASTEAPTA